MEPANPEPPRLARDVPRAARPSSEPRTVRRPRTEDDPEAAARRILSLLEKDLYLPAREAAAEAIARFPEHPRLKTLWRVFDNRDKSWVVPGGPEPGRKEEFEWLRHPPEWARGKWVALVGSTAVAVAETLREVAASVRSQNLTRRPLVHRID